VRQEGNRVTLGLTLGSRLALPAAADMGERKDNKGKRAHPIATIVRHSKNRGRWKMAPHTSITCDQEGSIKKGRGRKNRGPRIDGGFSRGVCCAQC